MVRMDAIIAVSPESPSYLKVPCTVISHGLDTSKFHPSPDRFVDAKCALVRRRD
jgi:mannosyltransferase